VPDTPLVPGEAAALAETVAGLRAANARLRELIAERDELIAELRVQVAEAGELREQVEQLRREVADLAARVKQNEEFLPAALLGRAGQASPEVAAEEDWPQARPAEGAAGRDDEPDRSSRSRDPARAMLLR
jgi:chromosome segregation ATPase